MGNLNCNSNSIEFCTSFKDNLRHVSCLHQIQWCNCNNTPQNRCAAFHTSKQRCREYERRKTVWPITQIKRQFIPDFPYNSPICEKSFRVLNEVGSGSFGKVYKVLELKTNSVYALKTLSKSQLRTTPKVENFLNY